jgi:molybdopterin converting factor small subunit
MRNPHAAVQRDTITVFVPGLLRDYSDGASELPVTAPNVRAALEHVETHYPSLYRNICDETGRVRKHVNLFVNMDNIRDVGGLDAVLAPGDVLTILPSVSGG